MSRINLYFTDLNPSTQRKIVSVYGDNCNWDCIPMQMLDIEDDIDATIDGFLGDKNVPAHEDADKLFESDYEAMKDILRTAEEVGCEQDLRLKLQTFLLDLARRENQQKDLMESFPNWLGALHAYLTEG